MNLTTLFAVVVALAAPAPAVAAAPQSLPVPGDADAVAFTTGRVLWAEHVDRGPEIVREAPLSGGPPSSLATIARPGGRSDVEVSLAAAPAGFLLGVRDHGGDRVVLGAVGAPARTLLTCPQAGAAPTAVPGTSGFAFAACGTVATVTADGGVSPVPGVRVDTLAYAEPFLAVSAPGTVRVLDLATGAERRLPPGYGGAGSPLALLGDGTLVAGPAAQGSGYTAGLSVWAPDAAQPRVLGHSAGAELVFAAGGRVFTDLGVDTLADGRRVKVGAPGAGLPTWPVGFDGTSAAFTSVACTGRAQVTVVDVDAPRAPGAVDGCPVRVLNRTIRPGRATLRVVCRNGCTGELRFVPVKGPCDPGPAVEHVVDCPAVARARLRLGASSAAQRVPVRLIGRAARGRVRVALVGAGLELVGTARRTLLP